MYSTLSACRAYSYMLMKAADKNASSITNHDCAAVVLFSSEAGTRVALDAVQMLGGNGYGTYKFTVASVTEYCITILRYLQTIASNFCIDNACIDNSCTGVPHSLACIIKIMKRLN